MMMADDDDNDEEDDMDKCFDIMYDESSHNRQFFRFFPPGPHMRSSAQPYHYGEDAKGSWEVLIWNSGSGKHKLKELTVLI